MINKYEEFVLENKLNKYFNDEISYEVLNIENYLSINESISSEITDTINNKINTILLKTYEWSMKIVSKGIKLLNKILKVLSTIFKYISKFCNKHKKLCALIIILILMITIGAIASYAATNPDGEITTEMANAALGFIDTISSDLIENGHSEKSIEIAKSILTDIRDTGQSVDYSSISKEAQALSDTALKYVNNINNEETLDKLSDIGSKISSGFSRKVDGYVTTIGSTSF